MNSHSRRTVAAVASLLLIAGCSSNSSSGATTTSVAPATTETPPTIAAPTPEATTTEEVTSTTNHLVKKFVLRSDGLDEFDFGVSPETMIEALTTEFGAAEQQDTEYPIENALDSDSYGTDDELTTLYEFPFGRTLCWDFGFCVQLGGIDPDSPSTFTGWTYSDDRTQPVPTPLGWHLNAVDGLTIGMSLVEDPVYLMNFLYRAVECEEIAVGEVSGFTLELLSIHGPFPDFTVVGYGPDNIDDRKAVVITQINSGTLPHYTGGDQCGL